MATVSSLGVGSGLDLNTLLAGLTTAEQVPVTHLTDQQNSYNVKLSAYGTLKSGLGALQAAAAALGTASLFQGVKATSSATGVLTASATATARSGNYAVNVTQLAQAQSLVAAGVASTTTAIGAGTPATVTLQFGAISGGTLDPATGTYTGATFTADVARIPSSVMIDSSNNSLGGIRDAINANSATGVTATIVNDGGISPDRLVLTSNVTGKKSSLRITVSGDAALSNLLANDPVATQNMRQTVAGQDAKLTVNGLAISSASNSVSEAVQGTTMTLASTGSSNLSLTNNTDDVQTAITTFVNAYNKLQSSANDLSAFNVGAKTQSALTGDATLRNIQTQIRAQLSTPQTSGSLTVLSNIGVSFQRDGTLAIDSPKLTAALGSNVSGVQGLFSGVSGSIGLGAQLAALITGFSDSGGLLQAATNGVNNTLKSLATDIESAQAKADSTIARYKLQFQQLDVLMTSMKATSAYLTAQFAPPAAAT